MLVNLPTPSPLNQTSAQSPTTGTTETTESSDIPPDQDFQNVLSHRTQDNDAPLPAMQLPLVVTAEIPASDVTAELYPGIDGSILDATLGLASTVAEQVGLSDADDGAEAAQVVPGLASTMLPDRSKLSIGVQAYSLGTGGFDQPAEQTAVGLLPPQGKNLPSLVSVPGTGPEAGADIGTLRPAQQGVLPVDPETSGSMPAKPFMDTSLVAMQSATRTTAGTAGGALFEADNPGDLQAVSARPAADNVVAATGVAGDVGKPVAAAASDAARPSSWLLEQSVHSRNWEDGFGDRVLWLANNRQPVAELRLNPPHLGSVDVRITVQGDQAQVLFQVPGGAAREAVDAALPRLREMFAEAGLNLMDVNVSDHPSHEGSNADEETDEARSQVAAQTLESSTETGHAESTAIRGSSQLDLFA